MKIVKSWHASSCGRYDAGGGGFEAAATADNAVSDGRKTSSDVVVADFNGDGFMDIFVSTVEGTNDLLVNDGKGVFTRAADDPTVGVYGGRTPRTRDIPRTALHAHRFESCVHEHSSRIVDEKGREARRRWSKA